jgi:uncharacterized membrane protein YgcG
MTLSRQQRVLVAIGAAGGACAIAIPAALALSHNPTFGQRIPVHVPSSAHVVRFDNHGGVVEAAHHPRHHRDDPTPRKHGDPITSTVASTHEPEPGDDRGRGTEPSDDRGRGNEPGDDRSTTTSSSEPEPGDDRTTPAPSSTEPEPGDDHGGDHGGNRGPGSGSGSSSNDNRGPGDGSASSSDNSGRGSNSGSGGGSDDGGHRGGDDGGHHGGGDN